MLKYLNLDSFLELIKGIEVSHSMREITENELKETFELVDKNDTKIEKQIGFVVPHSYKSEVITTGKFSPLKVGDLVIMLNNRIHYLIVVEDVVDNGNTVR